MTNAQQCAQARKYLADDLAQVMQNPELPEKLAREIRKFFAGAPQFAEVFADYEYTPERIRPALEYLADGRLDEFGDEVSEPDYISPHEAIWYHDFLAQRADMQRVAFDMTRPISQQAKQADGFFLLMAGITIGALLIWILYSQLHLF